MSQAKRHNCPFKESVVSTEGYFSFIAFSNTYQIIHMTKIDLGIDMYFCHMQVHLSRNYIPAVKSPPNIQVYLPQQPSFSQHVLWWCCNHLDILSSIVEILLFNLVFHDGVTLVSVSTLKPLLGVIGVLPLKPQASPILSVCI